MRTSRQTALPTGLVLNGSRTCSRSAWTEKAIRSSSTNDRLTWMARSRPAKKSEPAPPAERRVLPIELHVGDRLTDETGEGEIVGRPYSSNAGKIASARVRRV